MNTCYHRCQRSTKSDNSFPALTKPVKENFDVPHGKNNHWIIKSNQRKCGGCHKTKSFCEKRNVALHPECFKIFPEK